MVANAGICVTKSLLDSKANRCCFACAMLIRIIALSATTSDWDRIASINNRGTFLSYKYAAIQMIAQCRGGRIIGASSVAGKQGTYLHAGPQMFLTRAPGVSMLSAYCTSKFAIRGLTQAAGTSRYCSSPFWSC